MSAQERERAGVRVRRAAIKRFFDGVLAALQGARAQTKLGMKKLPDLATVTY